MNFENSNVEKSFHHHNNLIREFSDA